MKLHTVYIAIVLAIAQSVNAQIVINEVTSRGALIDASGEQVDWIEIYNAGPSAVNLQDYGLSDDALFPQKWQFPNLVLEPAAHVLVLANGLNTLANVNHWESAVYNNDTWKYKLGVSAPPADWNTIGFVDAAWSNGVGGIGYGDGDDGTTIAATISVFMRKGFTVDDLTVIENAKLHADYDDAFVAYLNGVEIARSGNILGSPPAYNAAASVDHEAGLYAGYDPEEWNISADIINSLLVTGTNYFCVQTHNTSAASSDLSSNYWLSFGINTTDNYFYTVPVWFNASVEYNQTSFKISNTGETIYLSDASGVIIDSKYTGDIALGQSLMRKPDGAASWCIADAPTPGYTNNSAACFSGYEPDPIFSVASGFYTGTELLYISSPSPTSVIHYTLDGSAVTASSPIYTSAILISENKVVSAKCYSSGGLLPGKQIKQSYFINEDEYTLPILSISIDPGSLYDYDTGIYELGCCYDVNYPYFGANFWQPWERFGHIEYFTVEGVAQWEKDMNLEIHGGWSRAEAQKGFRVDFKNEFDGSLEYPLWGAKSDMGPINNFNLRSGGQHVWTYKIQDAFLAKVMKDTYIDYEEWQPCMLFINGEPFGLYEIREKADEHFVESNYGIDNNKVDLLNSWTVLNGSDTGYYNMYYSLMATAPATDAYYNKFAQYNDIENYVDYYIGQIYYQNVDFGGYYWGVNNTKLWRAQDGGKWRFIMYDLDGAMGYFGSVPSDNYINLTRSPYYPNVFSQVFDRSLYNIQLRDYFVNRFADLINTIYRQENMEAIVYAMRDSIITEIPHQVEVWGAPNEATVDAYVNSVLSYNNTRRSTARSHINTSFALQGQRTVTLSVEPAGAGYIKINTITPTTLPWSGIYFDGVPVTITAIANPGYTFSSWDDNDLIPTGSFDVALTINMEESEAFNAVFTGAPITPDLVVTEINYNSNNDFESGDWFEIYNNGTAEIELSEWKIKDRDNENSYTIPLGTKLGVSERLVVAQKPILFSAIHPDVTNVIGGFDFELDNSGDAIRLIDLSENTVLNMSFADSSAWPEGADGTGRTLELTTPAAAMNNPASWFDGCLLGSPGTDYLPCNDAIVFSEINYNSSIASDAGDWIELLNASPSVMDISGWRFVDDKDTLLFTIAEGTILAPNERLVVASDIAKLNSLFPTVTDYTGPFLFGLNGSNEELRLFDANGILQLTVIYNNDYPWPLSPDGGGYTLELLDANGKMNNAENWFDGCLLGSPSYAYNPDCQLDINNLFGSDITIYPNPTNNFFTIELIGADNFQSTIQLIDAMGKIVMELENVQDNIITVSTAQLISGMYWVKFYTGNGTVTKALVKY